MSAFVIAVLCILGVLALGALVFILLANFHPKVRDRVMDRQKETKQRDFDQQYAEENGEEGEGRDSMFCKYCGAKIDGDSQFCKHCGREL